MEKIIVRGGQKLNGTVKVEGAKNAVLPVIAASLLASEEKSVICDVPTLSDVYTINEVLRHLGADVHFENNEVTVNASYALQTEAPFEYVRKMRASVLVMGPLLARTGHARVALPGGCAIGSRPIDQHLKGFEAMGAEIKVGNGFIEAEVKGRLQGAKIYLDFPSVGATENLIMAAALAEGTTTLENVAKEPEIVDLANYINGMGGKIRGAGTGTIKIEGVEKLHGVKHHIIPDRIEAGTFMVAAAITEGNVFIGGESTRPGAECVSEDEEMSRVIPVIERITKELGVPISVDTYKASVADEAVKAGASIINDIWGAKHDPKMASVAAEHHVPIVLMHNRPERNYNDLLPDMLTDLMESVKIAVEAGVDEKNIILDPGIGSRNLITITWQ